ncbi:hypothetical protein ACJJIW_13440 [Microbulbifer sp. JMSA004]|uniref:hypothetical protein n=1 Tax=unclassified Microbulbifer TaxID=2619833 RepID=UPI0024ADA2FB|nr:hypothetical protein [Microbulbifer sp. VAAF005]WHI47983.1 hypothetical protein P0078_06265 [Microbulbifer sp. VAAF005]
MPHVNLNTTRANKANSPEDYDHASTQQRIRAVISGRQAKELLLLADSKRLDIQKDYPFSWITTQS